MNFTLVIFGIRIPGYILHWLNPFLWCEKLVRLYADRFGLSVFNFVLINALRNPRRAALSISSVAVSLFLLVTLQVALRELTMPPPSAGAELRVAVRNKISLTNPLPARQRGIIEKIPGVEAVSPFTWFGGKYKGEEAMSFAQFAIDPTRVRLPATSQASEARVRCTMRLNASPSGSITRVAAPGRPSHTAVPRQSINPP